MLDLEKVKTEYQELLEQLSDPELISNWDKFEELNKRKIFLEKIIEKEKEIEDLKNKIGENKAILNSQEDQELFSLAETEIGQLTEKLKNLEEDIRKMPAQEKESSKDPDQSKAAIIEIRAGTGGEEASLFAADLFRMYSRYAQLKGWKQKVLDSRPSEIGAFKEIVFETKGVQLSPAIKYQRRV